LKLLALHLALLELQTRLLVHLLIKRLCQG
jgi:hypothetical protein